MVISAKTHFMVVQPEKDSASQGWLRCSRCGEDFLLGNRIVFEVAEKTDEMMTLEPIHLDCSEGFLDSAYSYRHISDPRWEGKR